MNGYSTIEAKTNFVEFFHLYQFIKIGNERMDVFGNGGTFSCTLEQNQSPIFMSVCDDSMNAIDMGRVAKNE